MAANDVINCAVEYLFWKESKARVASYMALDRAMAANDVINYAVEDLTLKEGNAGVCRDIKLLRGTQKKNGIHIDPNATYREYVVVSDGSGAGKCFVCSDDFIDMCRAISVAVDGQGSRLEMLEAHLDRLSRYMQHRSANKFQSIKLGAILFVLVFIFAVVLLVHENGSHVCS